MPQRAEAGRPGGMRKSLNSLWITSAGGGKMAVDSASAGEFPPIGWNLRLTDTRSAPGCSFCLDH